jgi:hypothetical protein
MTDPFATLSESPSDKKEEEVDPFAVLSAPAGKEEDPFAALNKDPFTKEGQIDDEDLKEIATRRGVSVDALKEALPYKTGITGPSTPSTDLPQKIAGEAGKIAFNLPQKAYTLLQSPKMQDALDDLQALVEDRKTGAQIASEVAVNVAGGVALAAFTGGASLLAGAGEAVLPTLAKETAKRGIARAAITGAAEGAAAGALTGVGTSRTGEELSGAARGAVMPGVLGATGGATIRGVQQYLKVRGAVGEEALAELKKLADDNAPKVDAVLAATKEKDAGLLSHILDSERLATTESALKAAVKGGDKQLLEEATDTAQRVIGFGEFIAGRKGLSIGSAVEEIEKAKKVFGEQLTDTYSEYIRSNALAQVVGDVGAGGVKRLSTMSQRALDLSMAGRYVAGSIDRRLGTDLVRVMDNFATRDTAFKIRQGAAQEVINTYIRTANKLGLKPAEIYSAMKSTDDVAELTRILGSEDKGNLVKGMKDFLENVRQDLGKGTEVRSALNIPKREMYLPQKTAEDAVIIGRLDSLNKQVEKELDTKLASPSLAASQKMQSLLNDWTERVRNLVMPGARKLTEKEAAEVAEFNSRAGSLSTLFHAVDYLHAGDKMPKNIDEVLKFSRSLDNSNFLGAKTEKIAGSALERTLNAPDIVLEQNPFKLMTKYTYDMYRVAHYKDSIDKLKGAQLVAERSGDTRAQSWITNALQDLGGVRPGTGMAVYKAATQALQIVAVKKAGECVPGSIAHSAYTYMAESPEALGTMLNSVYPYYLGSTLKSFTNNLGSAVFTLAPEIGIANSPAVFKGFLRAAKMIATGETIILSEGTAHYLNQVESRTGNSLLKAGEAYHTRDISKFTMNTLGSAGSIAHDAFTTLNKGLDSNVVARVAAGAVNKWTSFAMTLFEKSESLNRFVALSVGQDVAREMMTKGPAAMKVLGSMDKGYQKVILAAIQAGDRETVQAATQRWLVAKTMFDYNRLNQAEAARFMGPLFSVFTTYPANVWGDVVETMRSKGALKGGGNLVARRLLPLMAALAIGNHFIPDQGESAISDQFFGKEKLAGMTPIQSLTSIGTRGISPPGIALAGQGIKAVATGDVYEFWKFFNGGAAFVPGASFLRFLTSTAQPLIGDRPTQGTVLGRTAEMFSGGNILIDDRLKEFTRSYKDIANDPLENL